MRKFNSCPPAIKVTKNGVEYLDNCNQAMYYIEELIHAALRDTGKYITKEARKKLPKKSGRARKFTQYWVRKKELDLQVGYKPQGFYGGFFELGTEKTPKISPIYSAVKESIDTIQRIQGQYLSEMNKPKPTVPIVSGDDTEATE
jgi:hypothetical protein